MRLLVAGGAGFIGSTFVRRRLGATSDSIVVVDKLTYAGSRANLEDVLTAEETRDRVGLVVADIADRALMAELAADTDAIVNFAAESHVDRSLLEADAFLHTGVMGVYSLLEAARASQEQLGTDRPFRFLQVSTDEVYGPVPTGLSEEDDVLRPSSPYSAAKAAGEHLVGAYHQTFGLDTVITRGANTYGPRQFPEKLIPLFITNALQDAPLPMYGDGLQKRSWLYVDDHADAVGAVLDRGQSGSAYNVPGEGPEQTNRTVTELILDELDKPWGLVRTVADRAGHDRRYALDGRRIAALGWQASVAFEDGLRRTVRWYAEHADWWRAARDPAFDAYYERQYAWRLEQSSEA